MGELIFTTYEWGPDENGDLQIRNTNLKTHICTAEELGLTDNKSKSPSYDQFFKLHEKSVAVVKLYQKKFLCVGRDD